MATTVLTSCDSNEQLMKLQQRSKLDHHHQTASEMHDTSVDKVKRCLFGVVDHQTTRDDLAALRRQLDAQSRQRWNFDFRSGTPLTSLPRSTATCEGGARWVWTQVSESRHTQRTHAPSPGPRRPSDTDRSCASAAKRRRMSLMPSLDVKAKVTGSELKVVSRRKSVGGLERRGSLRSTSLLGSPSRMFLASFFATYRKCHPIDTSARTV